MPYKISNRFLRSQQLFGCRHFALIRTRVRTNKWKIIITSHINLNLFSDSNSYSFFLLARQLLWLLPRNVSFSWCLVSFQHFFFSAMHKNLLPLKVRTASSPWSVEKVWQHCNKCHFSVFTILIVILCLLGFKKST